MKKIPVYIFKCHEKGRRNKLEGSRERGKWKLLEEKREERIVLENIKHSHFQNGELKQSTLSNEF